MKPSSLRINVAHEYVKSSFNKTNGQPDDICFDESKRIHIESTSPIFVAV